MSSHLIVFILISLSAHHYLTEKYTKFSSHYTVQFCCVRDMTLPWCQITSLPSNGGFLNRVTLLISYYGECKIFKPRVLWKRIKIRQINVENKTWRIENSIYVQDNRWWPLNSLTLNIASWYWWDDTSKSMPINNATIYGSLTARVKMHQYCTENWSILLSRKNISLKFS